MTREQLDAIRARLDGGYELSRLDMALLLAEVERLRAELDTVGEVLAATSLKCDYAFKRGVAAMRAAAVEVASKRANLQRFTDSDMAWGRSAQCILDELRHLSVPEDKS